MKRFFSLIIIVALFLIPESLYAQLRIVGVNTDAPESKINYLENPVQVENFLPPYKPSNRRFPLGALPNNEQLYLSEYYEFGYRFDSDSSLVVGIPEGYYNISGCYIYNEEIAPIQAKTMKIVKAQNTSYPYQQKRYNSSWQEVEAFKTYFYDFELTKQQLQEKISINKNPSIEVPIYTLTNQKGEEFFIKQYFFRDAKYVMVDYVSFIEGLYKGKDFYFYTDWHNQDYVTDRYKNLKVPIKTADNHDRLGSIFFTSLTDIKTYTKRIMSNVSYHCSDILVDGNSIIAVLESPDGNKFSFAIGGKCDARYSAGFGSDTDFYLDCRYVSGEEGLVFFTKDQIDNFISDYSRLATDNRIAREKLEAELASQEQRLRKELAQKYGDENAELIIKHKLAIGMTKEMCLASIGFPSRRYKTTTEYGETEIFFYAYMAVHFFNGRITRITEAN